MSKIDKIVVAVAAAIALAAGAAAIFLKPAQAPAAPDAANAASAAGQGADEEQQLTEAPDITVFDAEGNEITLSSLRGRPVVLNFWATWCGYCVMEMPDFDEVYAEYGDRVDFMIINATDEASGETIEKAAAFIEEKGYSFPSYYDTGGEAAAAYQVTGLPTTVVVDEKGYFYGYVPGMISGDVLRDALDGVLALYE